MRPASLITFCLTFFLVCAAAPDAQETLPVSTDFGKETVLFQTGFEPGQTPLDTPNHAVVEEQGRNGSSALVGDIAGPDEFLPLDIPFRSSNNKPVELTFWIKSEMQGRCAVYGGTKDRLRPLTNIADLPQEWTLVKVTYKPFFWGDGLFRIFAPVSIQAPPGKAWLDDITLTELQPPAFERDFVQDFPAMTSDQADNVWMAAMIEREQGPIYPVYRLDGNEARQVASLEPEFELQAWGAPVIAGLDEGCVVVFPAETDGHWRICFSFIGPDDSEPSPLQTVGTPGDSNVRPAVAASGDDICLVWEANPEGQRGIYASWLSRAGATTPTRISGPGHISCKPSVAVLEDGKAFAAWDSVRNAQSDIYGAWFRNGNWKPEKQLTDHPQIERHASLSAHTSDIWMAWQAQTFDEHYVNQLNVQQVAVARLGADGLEAPLNLFTAASPAQDMLIRPRIAFDPNGRLWLTARKSMGMMSGWQPLAWCYTGAEWTGPHALWPDEGRWRPVELAWTRQGGYAAVQRDHAVGRSNVTRNSEVMVVPLRDGWAGAAGPMELETLTMPETEFVLQDRLDQSAEALPRQRAEYKGETLTLYWGDLHEHTSISTCQRSQNPPPEDLYANQRDIEGLDFTAITDHGCHMDGFAWDYLIAETTATFDTGKFVTFLAEEWTSDQKEYDPPRTYKRYGHRNLVFLDPRYPRFFDSRPGNPSPRDLWKELAGVEFITIPHQLADHGTNCPTDWTFVDERLQPLAEIYQQRESYEYDGCPRQAAETAHGHFLQDAWAMGNIIGVIASPDHGGGHGKAGIWARELTRESLFEAFRARHTFGTSDPKMGLFFTAGEAMMGDKVTKNDSAPIAFHVKATTMRPIKEVVIWRNNQIAYHDEPDTTELDFDWVDQEPLDAPLAWYYVRLHCTDDELAWSSPIWFVRKQAK